MCLTPQVRRSLSDTDGRNIEILVKEAEERNDAHQAAALSHPVSQNINLTTVRQHGNQPTASTTTNNDTPTAGHFICWYHSRYDDNARKCSQSCQYQSKKLYNRLHLNTAAATSMDSTLGFYITDELTGTRFLVDTGAFCSIYPAGFFGTLSPPGRRRRSEATCYRLLFYNASIY